MLMLIITIAALGFLVWLVTTKVPMADGFKTVIYVVAVIVLFLYLMSAFGVMDVPIPRLR